MERDYSPAKLSAVVGAVMVSWHDSRHHYNAIHVCSLLLIDVLFELLTIFPQSVRETFCYLFSVITGLLQKETFQTGLGPLVRLEELAAPETRGLC